MNCKEFYSSIVNCKFPSSYFSSQLFLCDLTVSIDRNRIPLSICEFLLSINSIGKVSKII